jgi:glutathione reductase (NADPH)
VAKFGAVDVYTSSFRPMRNTISGSAMRTFMKLVVAADSDVVVGCHMVGDDSAEIMQVREHCCAAGGVSRIARCK